jgi:hypothetical protein
MIGKGRLQRGIIVRVDTRKTEPVRSMAVVADLEPHGLDPSARQRHAEKALALPVIQNRDPDFEFVILLDLRSLEERPFLGSRRVQDAEQAKSQEVIESHRCPRVAAVRLRSSPLAEIEWQGQLSTAREGMA